MAYTEEQKKKNQSYIESLLQSLSEFFAGLSFSSDEIKEISGDEEKLTKFNDQMKPFCDVAKQQGFTTLDLMQAAKEADGPIPNPRGDAPEPKAPAEGEPLQPKPTAYGVFKTEIENAYDDLTGTLSIFSNDSDEFKKYLADLKKVRDYMQRPANLINPEDGWNIQFLLEDLQKSRDKYYEVRSEKSKKSSSTRSNNRLEISSRLKGVIDRMLDDNHGIHSAVNAHIKERVRVSGKMVQRYEDAPKQTEEEQQKNIDSFTNIAINAFDHDMEVENAMWYQSKKTMEDKGLVGTTDDRRYERKAMLDHFVNQYKGLSKNNSKLTSILKDIETYSKTDVTAVKGKEETEKEYKLFEKIYKDLSNYYDEIQNSQAKGGMQDDLEDDYLRMTASMLTYFESQRNGDLAEIKESARHIHAEAQKIKTVEGGTKSRKNDPLFPHDPSPNDIVQGGLGDCYLVSALSAIAMQNPQAIKDAIKDNGDGTVTVRFYNRTPNEYCEVGTQDSFEPVYVTVDKIVPSSAGAEDCLWVQMFERAYAASGLRIATGRTNIVFDKYARPVPENINELYAQYKKMNPNDLPTHDECPWLISPEGKLHPWEPSYANIDGGDSGLFAEALLGEKYQVEHIKIAKRQDPSNIYQSALYDLFKETFPEGSANIDAETRESLLRQIENGSLSNENVVHAMLFNGELPQLGSDGRHVHNTDLDWDKSNKVNIMTMFSNEFFGKMSKDQGQYKSFADFPKYLDYVKNTDEAQLSHSENIVKNFIAQNPGYGKFVQDVCNKAAYKASQAVVTDKYDGNYTKEQLDILYKINGAVKSKNIVTAGTPEASSDKVTNKGLNLSHAYSVTGVVAQKFDNGKTLYFVKLRNPHGVQDVRDYDMNPKTGECKLKVNPSVEGAESLVELSDFFTDIHDVRINKEPEKKPNPKFLNEAVDLKTISHYGRALDSCIKALKDHPEKNNKQYNELTDSLEKARNHIRTYYGRESQDLNNYLGHLRVKIENYKDAANANPKKYKNLENVKAMNFITNAIYQGSKDPRADMQASVASRILSGIIDKYSQDKGAYKNMAEELKNNPGKYAEKLNEMKSKPEFKKYFASADTLTLGKMLNTPKAELAKAFMSKVKEPLINQKTKTVEANAIGVH